VRRDEHDNRLQRDEQHEVERQHTLVECEWTLFER
jgi:hypothetical protein